MKIRRIFLVSILLLMTISMTARPATPGYRKIPGHPRLCFPKGDEEKVRQNIEGDAYWEVLHNDILAESDRMIGLPLTQRYIRDGKRMFGTSREVNRRLIFLAYSYRMTGRREYLDRAEAEMINVCEFTDWNAIHFLDAAEMTMGLGIGYDWLYGSLKESTRKTVRDAIIKNAIEPSFERDWFWMRRRDNWNQVCHSGLMVGAATIYEYEPELARKVFERAAECLPYAQEVYEPAGVYPEGPAYWVYGTTYFLLGIEALTAMYGHDFGLSDSPGFMQTGFYYQQMEAPGGYRFNYSDNSPRSEFCPASFWFYKKMGDPRLIYMQKYLFGTEVEKDNPAYLEERFLPLVLVWAAQGGARLVSLEEPTELAYLGQGPAGVAVMRSSWSDPRAIYLGYKNGRASMNHGHMDVGSFFMIADGVRWALDLGPQSYSEAEMAGVGIWNFGQDAQRWDVYRFNNFSHNTPTINGRLHNVDGAGEFITFEERDSLMYVLSDITEVFTPRIKKYRRSVSLIEKKYVVVEDIVETGRSFTNVRWNMMTEAESWKKLGDNLYFFSKGDKKLYLRVEAPVGHRFRFREAVPKYSFEDENEGIYEVAFEFDMPLDAETNIKIYLMPGEIYQL